MHLEQVIGRYNKGDLFMRKALITENFRWQNKHGRKTMFILLEEAFGGKENNKELYVCVL